MDDYKAVELLNYAQSFDDCSFGAIKIAIDKGIEALKLKQKIIDIIRDTRFSDDECLEKIMKLVGIWHEF